MNSREILIVGATGQQGGATIAALRATSPPPHSPPIRIMALTRSLNTPKAQALQKSFPELTLVEGDVANPTAIFTSQPSISSIFLVTVPPSDEEQALPMIDAAIAHGVPHIVFSSVDRGGEETSWTNPTTIPHFAAKHRIELHFRQACLDSQTQWTILRPAGFMDNYTPGHFGKMMAGLWATMPTDRKMQLVSVHDIGMLAAKALLDPDRWVGKAVGIAGDDLTFQEGNAVFLKVVGYEMPKTWGLMSRGVRWGIEDANKSMDWFERVGFGVNIEALRRKVPELQSFEDWLRTSGHWVSNDGI